jgi:hypothetical protein
MMAARVIPPADPEERQRWARDPAAYEAIERLHDAQDALDEATDAVSTTIARLFETMHEEIRSVYAEKRKRLPTQADLTQAHRVSAKAQLVWATALADAEVLLRDRFDQEGGDA